MNKIVLNKNGALLLIQTKFGNIQIEQLENETSVKLIENEEGFSDYPSHLEDKSTPQTLIISMVRDE